MKPAIKVIDIHTHPIFFGEGKKERELDDLVKKCRARGVVHMNSLGDVLLYGHSPDADQIRKINNQNGRIQRLHPDYFTSFCHVNPTLGELHVMHEVERCVTRFNSKGIKLEIANNASAPCMQHVAKAALEFDLIVLQHTWSKQGSTSLVRSSLQSDPVDTAIFARRNPEVRIIMAHLSGFGFRGVLEVKQLPNVSIDTSGGYPEEGMIEYAVEHLGANRVFYGSDLPIREHSVTIGRVLGARIKPSEKTKILYSNAASWQAFK